MATTATSIKSFLTASKKLIKNQDELDNPTRENRAFIRENVEFLVKFPEAKKILDDESKTDLETIRELFRYFAANKTILLAKEEEAVLAMKVASFEEAKAKSAVVVEILVQVFDNKTREYTDDFEIVMEENSDGIMKPLRTSFGTEAECRKWAANKLHRLVPANRHVAKIIDNRFNVPKETIIDAYEGDKLKTQKLGHETVNKQTRTNAPLKQKMKAKGDVFKFSKG